MPQIAQLNTNYRRHAELVSASLKLNDYTINKAILKQVQDDWGFLKIKTKK